jgi:hypothetical protein
MQFDFLVPGLLGSPVAQNIREIAPALATILARASVQDHPSESLELWIAKRFAITKSDEMFPFAALGARAESISNANEKYWLRADPVHLSVNRDRMVLLDASQLDITDAESIALAGTLQDHFKNDDFTIHAPHPERWYISSNKPIALRSHPISEVCGCNVADYWFDGPDRTRWQTRLSEMQMLLHAHPVNEARDAAGQLPINGIWFWGAGESSSFLSRDYAQIVANDVLLEGIASLTATKFVKADLFDQSKLSSNQAESTLVALDQLAIPAAYGEWETWQTSLAALDQVWFAPALSALKNGHLKEIKIYAPSKKHSLDFSLKRIDLMKFWRQSKIV